MNEQFEDGLGHGDGRADGYTDEQGFGEGDGYAWGRGTSGGYEEQFDLDPEGYGNGYCFKTGEGAG